MIPVTVTVSSTVNLSPMVASFSQQAKQVAGEAPASATELQDVLAHVEETLDANAQVDIDATRKQVSESLPNGATLVALTHSRQGLTVTSGLSVRVDDVMLLAKLPALHGFTVRREGSVVKVDGRAPGADQLELRLESKQKPLEHNAQKVEGDVLVWAGNAFEVQVSFSDGDATRR